MSTIEPVSDAAIQGINIDIATILKFLPHRYPFLLIDRAFITHPGIKGSGYKNVSINEPYFSGHFPEEPIVPGVLICESLAQLIAVIYNSIVLEEGNSVVPDTRERVGYLASVNVKFLSLVRPGDRLDLEAERICKIGTMSQFDVRASVAGKIAVKGQISVTERKE